MRINVEIDFSKRPDELNILQFTLLNMLVQDKEVMEQVVESYSTDNAPFELLHVLDELEDLLYIKHYWDDESGCNIELRKKATDLFPKSTGPSFDEFWEKWHDYTKQPKTDKKAAEGYWKRLRIYEKNLAIEKIKEYVDYIISTQGRRYLKKARTYLDDKNFNDELKSVEEPTQTGQGPIIKFA